MQIPTIGRSSKKAGGPGKKIKQFSKDGKCLGVFQSLTEASKETGIGIKNISRVMNKSDMSAGGYRWFYADKEYIYTLPPAPKQKKYGYTVTEISEKMGMPETTVRYIIKKATDILSSSHVLRMMAQDYGIIKGP